MPPVVTLIFSETYSWFLSVQWTQETLNGMYQYFIKVLPLHSHLPSHFVIWDDYRFDWVFLFVLTLGCKVVPTEYTDVKGHVIQSNQVRKLPLRSEPLTLGCNLCSNIYLRIWVFVVWYFVVLCD